MIVKVGIYWVIHGKIYPFIEEREADKLYKREILTGKVDSNYDHFSTWDIEFEKMFPHTDYSTFPRGRIMFDTIENRNIIYADECISADEIAQLEAIFQTINAKVCRDEHYACDKCIKNK